jgi:hypothetical protein
MNFTSFEGKIDEMVFQWNSGVSKSYSFKKERKIEEHSNQVG